MGDGRAARLTLNDKEADGKNLSGGNKRVTVIIVETAVGHIIARPVWFSRVCVCVCQAPLDCMDRWSS